MCPSTEKMAKPAKKLVQQFPMAMTKVSLQGKVSQPHTHGVRMETGASLHGPAGLRPPHDRPAPPQLQPRGCPDSPSPPSPRAPAPRPRSPDDVVVKLVVGGHGDQPPEPDAQGVEDL